MNLDRPYHDLQIHRAAERPKKSLPLVGEAQACNAIVLDRLHHQLQKHCCLLQHSKGLHQELLE